MNFRIGAFAALLVLTGAHQAGPPSQGVGQAIVRGTVTDVSSAGISNAQLRFASNGHETIFRSISDGTYAAQLPAGVYTLRVKSPGFCDGRRAEFDARADAEIHFDFTLSVGAVADEHTVDAGGHDTQHDELICDDKWEELPAPGTNGLKPLVNYGKREETDGSVRYSGHTDAHWQFPPVYMFDLLTIQANTLSYSTRDHSVVGTGSVMLLDGQRTKNGSRIELAFPDGSLQINLTEYPRRH
jgi:Carboxypeptidase regulatory-like domain